MPSCHCWSRTGTRYAQGTTHRPTATAAWPPAPGVSSRAPLGHLDSQKVPAPPSPCWTAPLHSQRHGTLSQSLGCCQLKRVRHKPTLPEDPVRDMNKYAIALKCPHVGCTYTPTNLNCARSQPTWRNIHIYTHKHKHTIYTKNTYIFIYT